MRVGIWVCDGCGIEDRGGMPGFPPDDWIRAKATAKSRVESPAHDFCSACAWKVNLHELAETGTLIVQPKTRKTTTKSESKVTESGGDDLDDDEGETE